MGCSAKLCITDYHGRWPISTKHFESVFCCKAFYLYCVVHWGETMLSYKVLILAGCCKSIKNRQLFATWSAYWSRWPLASCYSALWCITVRVLTAWEHDHNPPPSQHDGHFSPCYRGLSSCYCVLWCVTLGYGVCYSVLWCATLHVLTVWEQTGAVWPWPQPPPLPAQWPLFIKLQRAMVHGL